MPSAQNAFPRLIALDIDGTILTSDRRLEDRVLAAIGRALAAGIQVLPATGRQLDALPREMLAIPGLRYAITSNGAKVYDLAQDTVLYSDCFEKADALDVLRAAEEYQALTGVYIDGRGYSQQQDLSFLRSALPGSFFEYFRQTRTFVPNLASFVRAAEGAVEKFTLHFASQPERRRARADFERRGDVELTSSVFSNLELNTPTANKGAALMHLAALLGIPRAEVMAMGDSSNDATMLRMAGQAVVMANAPDEIKALADILAPSCDEAGVAAIIEGILG